MNKSPIKSPTRADVQEFAEKLGFPSGSRVFDIHITPHEVSVCCHLIYDGVFVGDVTYKTPVALGGDA